MEDTHPIEGYPSVRLLAVYENRECNVFLSSLYGSTVVEIDHDIAEGTVPDLLCWHCHKDFPEEATCPECHATMRLLEISDGPMVKICSRRGCPQHGIRFGQWDTFSVSSIMRRGVVTINRITPLKQITNILLNTDIHSLPVVDEERKLVGHISVIQLLTNLIPREVGTINYRSYRKLLKHYRDWNTLLVGDVMNTTVPLISPDTLLEEAAAIFLKTGQTALFAVREERVEGVIMASDLCKVLIEKRKEE